MTERQFSKGDVIVREGDQGESFFQIESGVVGIYGNYGGEDENLLTELKSGQYIGEMAVIDVYPRSATAVALEEVKVIEIASGEIDEYFRSQPDKILDIMKNLSGRLKSLTEDYTDVSEAIRQLNPGKKEGRNENLVAKIKKFARVYKNSKKSADIISAETLRKLETKEHAVGFSKNVESHNKGTIIFKEGEIGNCMYDVHSGKVAIYKDYGKSDETLLTQLMANEFFGEMGMVRDDRRTATAVVMENDTTIEIIYPEDLNELFNENPAKVNMILSHLSSRLRKLTKEYLEACKLIYEISDKEEKGEAISDELKHKAETFSPKYYD